MPLPFFHVRNQLSDMCRSFYKDLMASCLAAIQSVVIKQMCTMATVMRDGLSRSTSDGRCTGNKTSHLGTHRTRPHDSSAANGSFPDIGTNSQGINVANTRSANPEKPTEVPRNVAPTQVPIDPLPRSTRLHINDDATMAPSDINTSPQAHQGLSPNTINVDNVSNDNSRSPSTIQCAQVFRHKYDESTSKVHSLQNLGNKLTQSLCNLKTHMNDKADGDCSGKGPDSYFLCVLFSSWPLQNKADSEGCTCCFNL